METVRGIEPAEYILSVLSPQERLDIAFRIAREAFKDNTTLELEDIEAAIKRVRRKVYAAQKKTEGGH